MRDTSTVTERALRLSPDVRLEPLIHGWYAWTHLLAPHTAAMHVARAHLRIMEAYVAAPRVHAAAVKDPALYGGPFIDHGGGRVEEVRAHLAETRRVQAPLLELARAMEELEAKLAQAQGESLAPLYAELSPALAGLVELVYDLRSAPRARYLEGLLYADGRLRPGPESVRLAHVTGDRRPFALSTPRLPDPACLDLPVPLASEVVDQLTRSRCAPLPASALEPSLHPFCTEAPPPADARYGGDGLRVRYFGHAAVLLETREVSLFLDPSAAYVDRAAQPRFTLDDVPRALDYVALTHNHQDHVLLETLLELRPRAREVLVPRAGAGSLADPSLKLALGALGFRRVRELDHLESVEIPGGAVTAVPFLGEHGDLEIRTKAAYHVRLLGRSFLFAADSNNLDPALYRRVRAALGPVDVLFLGMECTGATVSWVYGPLFPRPLSKRADQSRRLDGSDCEKAWLMREALGATEVYVYAMGREPWLGFVMNVDYPDSARPVVESDRLVAACRAQGIEARRLFLREEWHYPGR